MKNTMPLGEFIRTKRLTLNLTMDKVAKEAGITRATLSALENGSTKCSLANLYKVLNILGIDLKVETNCSKGVKRLRATRTITALEKN